MVGDTRVPMVELTGVQGALMKRMVTRRFGRVPEPLGVMWNNRPVLKASMGMGRKAGQWKECDKHLKSYAHMAVVSLVGCTWCLDMAYFTAQNEELDVDKAREIPMWRESELFTALERDVLAYAEALSQTPPTVTDELSGRLLEALGAPALVELTVFASMANQVARTNVALGIESEGFSAACGLPPMAQPSGAASQP